MPYRPPTPASRWPYAPFWELEGFNFRATRVLRYQPNDFATCLHIREFTSAASAFEYRFPTREESTMLVCNNVAVQFRAMLYCRDSYMTDHFWDRVSRCAHGRGARLAEIIGGIFVEARRAHLQRSVARDCPNGAAKAVDDWIAFLDSNRGISPPAGPWETRFEEWGNMKRNGGLLDAGYYTHNAREVPGVPVSEPRSSSPRTAQASAAPEDHSLNPDIKRESASPEPEEHPLNPEIERESSQEQANFDNMSMAELDATHLANGSPRRKTKRKRSETFETPSPSPAERSRKRLARTESRSPSVEIIQELSVPAKRKPGHRSTKARVTDCEEKLAEHMNLIHAQDSKLSAQEELAAKQATKIAKLSGRVKSFEKKIPEDEEIETMKQSIAELTDRVNNRSTYIRTEIRKQWTDVRTPYEQEQTRVNTRLDSFRDDLAVQKVRVEDCQKAVDEHIKKGKDYGTELSALEETVKKKSRIRRRQIEKLSNRVAELEGKLGGHQPAAADSDNEDTDEEDAPQVEARLANLTQRIAKLEKKQADYHEEQQSAMDEVLGRLDAMETNHRNLKTESEATRKSLQSKTAALRTDVRAHAALLKQSSGGKKQSTGGKQDKKRHGKRKSAKCQA